MRFVTRTLAPTMCALAFTLAVPTTARAQAYFFADAGVTGYGGDDLNGIKTGFGVEGGIGTRLGESFSIAGAFGWSTHSVDSDITNPCVNCGTDSDNVNRVSLMARPLVHFGGADGGTDFFVGAQGGYTSLGASEKVTGLVVGPVAGVGFPMGATSRFGVGGSYSALSLSDGVSGSMWSAVAFFSLGFGS